jgi:hypothetical protein
MASGEICVRSCFFELGCFFGGSLFDARGAGRFDQCPQTAGTDIDSLAFYYLALQVEFLAADGFDVGVTAPVSF